MAIVVGKKTSRTVPIKALEPLNNDKTAEHRFNIDVTVLPSDQWRAITARWEQLGELLKREQYALAKGLDFEPLSDDERAEAKAPAIESIKHLITDADLDVENDSGELLAGRIKIDEMVKIPWLAEPMFDAVVAVQGGKTVEAYRKLKQKN
jgi:hypothetical protein